MHILGTEGKWVLVGLRKAVKEQRERTRHQQPCGIWQVAGLNKNMQIINWEKDTQKRTWNDDNAKPACFDI